MNKSINNNGYDYVDLGLPSGTLWATMNVGASNPLDYGLYFKWGETKGYAANQAEPAYTLDNCTLSTNISDREPFTKYNSENSILKLEDDAVHVNMGGDWHMPSPTQIQELIDNTASNFETVDGVRGMKFTSKNGKSIFLPAAGLIYGKSVLNSGYTGTIWSSMLSDSHVPNGYTFYFYSGGAELGTDNRNYKFPVRGVIDKKSYNSKEKKNNMNENLNLIEILKDAPKGTKLWSPICGDCILDKIDTRDTTVNYAIYCLTVNDHSPVHFTANGKYTFCFDDGECVLFPSKENRDWSTFKIPKKHKEFKPFQKVLRVDDNSLTIRVWATDFYSHYDETICKHFLTSGFIKNDNEILPYEGNEDKLGKEVEK